MKRIFGTLLLALLAAGTLGITGCGEDTVEPVDENDKKSNVRITHAADAYTVDVIIDGEEITTNAIFGDNINYRKVPATNVPVKIVNAQNDSVIFQKTFNFVADRSYTLFVTNDSTGAVDVLSYTDDLTPPNAGSSLVRPVHLIYDGPKVRVALQGVKRLADSIAYGQIMESFNTITPGTYNVRIISTTEFGSGDQTGGAEAVIEKQLTFESGKIYSVLASGSAAQPSLTLINHN